MSVTHVRIRRNNGLDRAEGVRSVHDVACRKTRQLCTDLCGPHVVRSQAKATGLVQPLTRINSRRRSTGVPSLPSMLTGSRPSSPYSSCTMPPVEFRTVLSY